MRVQPRFPPDGITNHIHVTFANGDLTLEELIPRHEKIQIENVYSDIQLADANTRIEELDQENVYLHIQLADANTRIEELEGHQEMQKLVQ